MLWILVLVLLAFWLVGGFIVPVGSGLIHLLLVIALICVVWNFVGNGRGRDL